MEKKNSSQTALISFRENVDIRYYEKKGHNINLHCCQETE